MNKKYYTLLVLVLAVVHVTSMEYPLESFSMPVLLCPASSSAETSAENYEDTLETYFGPKKLTVDPLYLSLEQVDEHLVKIASQVYSTPAEQFIPQSLAQEFVPESVSKSETDASMNNIESIENPITKKIKNKMHSANSRQKGRFKCPTCKEVLSYAWGLKSHMRDVHQPHFFNCSYASCSAMFKRNSDYNRHMKEKHGIAQIQSKLRKKRGKLKKDRPYYGSVAITNQNRPITRQLSKILAATQLTTQLPQPQ